VSAFDCLIKEMQAGYAKSGHKDAAAYISWRAYSRQPYQSATHGNRYVMNYANAKGKAYGLFEKSGRMPKGAVLGKNSFAVNATGKLGSGPLFLMEKMGKGFNKSSGDWRYTMIMPNGAVFGETKGKNSAGMQFCIDCHAAVAEDQDHMMFLPEKYRTKL
jgi:hypothetical protein